MIKTYDRSCKMAELKPYDHFAKDDEFMEVIRWANEEGFDVVINDQKIYSFTDGQFECLQALVAYKE